MTTVAQLAAPPRRPPEGKREVSPRSPYHVHSPGRPRSPRKCRQLRSWQLPPAGSREVPPRSPCNVHSAGPPRSPRKCRQLRSWQFPPQGAARSRRDQRTLPIRWTSQEPPKVQTVAQLAAPPAGGREVPTRSAYTPTPLDLPGAHESADSCAVGSSPRRGPRGLGAIRV